MDDETTIELPIIC